MKIDVPNGTLPGAAPIYLKRGPVGVLLFHGTTSTPYCMKYLAEYLAGKGLTVYVPLLPGHGTKNVDDLIKTDDEIWRKAAEEEFLKFRKTVRSVFVGGLCTGGNLALDIASKYPAAGVMSLGSLIYLRGHAMMVLWLNILKHFKKTVPKEFSPNAYEEYYRMSGAYRDLPIKTFLEILTTMERTKKLSKITIPAFIMHTKHDYVISPRSATFIWKNLLTPESRKKLYFINTILHVPADIFEPWRTDGKFYAELYRFIDKYK